MNTFGMNGNRGQNLDNMEAVEMVEFLFFFVGKMWSQHKTYQKETQVQNLMDIIP